MTGQAAERLTELFQFAIPQRWSIAHLYQAILKGEPHVKDIVRINTLAGYVHACLTGRNVLGIGDVSGMFPIDSTTNRFDEGMLTRFAEEIAPLWIPVADSGHSAGGAHRRRGRRLPDRGGRVAAG